MFCIRDAPKIMPPLYFHRTYNNCGENIDKCVGKFNDVFRLTIIDHPFSPVMSKNLHASLIKKKTLHKRRHPTHRCCYYCNALSMFGLCKHLMDFNRRISFSKTEFNYTPLHLTWKYHARYHFARLPLSCYM